MNIKSILLGTAAALVAVSGARAADAVVMVEPEPVDYVRVCDVYGTGFFYIPGTETCLNVSGFVRMRLYANDEELRTFDADEEIGDYEDTVFGTKVRGRLNFDAREETELGTLRGFIRIQGTNTSHQNVGSGETRAAGATVTQAYLQLGGLTIGYLDSVWTNNDGGIEDGLYTDTSWAAGDVAANRISYTFASNGFSGTLSVEDDGDGDFTPDVVGKLAYTGGFGGAYIMGVFDEDSSDFATADHYYFYDINGDLVDYSHLTTREIDESGDGAFVVKAGIELENLLTENSAFKIEGHYAFDPSIYAVVGGLNGSSGFGTTVFRDTTTIPSEFQIGAGYTQKFDKLKVGLSGVYGETFDLESVGAYDFDADPLTPDTYLHVGSVEYFAIAANVGYDITRNFSVLGEISYRDLDLPSYIDDFDQTAGFIEFKRSF